MKRLVALSIVIVLVFGLAACQPKSTPETTPSTPAETPSKPADDTSKPWRIAMVTKDDVNPWFVRTGEGVKQFAIDSGTDSFQVGPAETDAALQLQVVEDIIVQDLDALCIYPIDPTTLEPVLSKAISSGIPVFVQEATSQESKTYALDPYKPLEYGAALMDSLAIHMEGEGKYVTMVSFLTNVSHNQWADGAVNCQKEKYPNITLLEGSDARVETGDELEGSYEKAKELLKKYPDLKGFIGTSSYHVPGVCRAIDELGLSGKVFVVGTGLPSMCEDYYLNGSLQSAFLWDPYVSIYALMALAKEYLDGTEIKIGLDLGIEGFNSLVQDDVDPKIFYGNGWVEITKDNYKNLGFWF